MKIISSTIDELCNIEYGTRVTRKKDGGEIYPVYGGGGKTFYLDKTNRNNRVVISRFAMSQKCTRFVEGDFFLNDSGLTLSPKNNELLQEYLDLIILGINDLIYDLGRGTAQRNLDMKKLRLIKISFPNSLSEQKRIVAKLNIAFEKIDNMVKSSQQQVAGADKIYTNILSQIFEQKGEGWIESRLKEITSKIGSGATPRGGKASYKEQGISLIRSMNVHDMRFSWKELAKIDEFQSKKLANVEVQKNDVLLNITGASVARCTLVPSESLPARVNQHVSIIRTDRTILSPQLLAYGLIARVNKKKLLEIGNNAGATRQAITKKDIEEFIFSYPKKLETQQIFIKKISDVKSKVNLLANNYKKKISNLNALKLAILKQKIQPSEVV